MARQFHEPIDVPGQEPAFRLSEVVLFSHSPATQLTKMFWLVSSRPSALVNAMTMVPRSRVACGTIANLEGVEDPALLLPERRHSTPGRQPATQHHGGGAGDMSSRRGLRLRCREAQEL